MKYLITFIVVFLTLIAHSGASEIEPPISEQTKIKITGKLNRALEDKTITKKQYDRAMVWLQATPCSGVDRSLSESKKRELAYAIVKHEGLQGVDVYQSFMRDDWTIVFVGTHASDEAYLFYQGDPVTARNAITEWSGAATIFETTEIRDWVLKNAPGIPLNLANCFAWHVTLNRH